MSQSSKRTAGTLAVGMFLVALTFLPIRYRPTDSWRDAESSAVRELASRPALCESLKQNNGESRFEIRFRPKELRNYQNVFQTSDGNVGVRLEIDEIGTIGLIVASSTGSFMTAVSTARAVVGKWTVARVQLKASGEVRLSVDDASTVQARGMPMPSCDRILLGAGFDGTRKFSGEVSAKMSAGTRSNPLPAYQLIRLLGQFFLLMGFVAWALKESESPNRDGHDEARQT